MLARPNNVTFRFEGAPTAIRPWLRDASQPLPSSFEGADPKDNQNKARGYLQFLPNETGPAEACRCSDSMEAHRTPCAKDRSLTKCPSRFQ